MKHTSQSINWKLIAEQAATLSNCKRKKTGAVVIDEYQEKYCIGYNHIPDNLDQTICDRCPREGKQPGKWTKKEECPVIHAEVAAILRAANCGLRTNNGFMYCTYKPCMNCAVVIVEAGIKYVAFIDEYPGGKDVEKYLQQCGVQLIKLC